MLLQAPTAAHAMLSLSEVCESSVMKVWLNCLEIARASAGAAIGSIASNFDVSMWSEEAAPEPEQTDRKRGSVGVYRF